MTAQEILKREFGADAQEIENEIRERINQELELGGEEEYIADILMDYGLEMDYIFEFI